MSGPQQGPLAGVRVLELARILAGPWAGQTLADLGAEVIKVERPGAGDDTRGWGPPFMEDKDGGRLSSSYNLACNRGKRSIAVDFETPDGQRIVRKLAARSDVLIENFKFGGLAKYGLDYKSLSAENPRLVYCSITGFGQDGPYKTRAGYDLLVQGMGGIMDITGDPNGEPTRLGVAFADVFTGVYSALAIMRRAEGARAHRQGQPHRHGADRLDGRRARQPGDLLSRVRQAAGAHGQCACERRALPDVPDHRRLDADRLRQRRPVREDDAGARRSGHGQATSATRPTPRAWSIARR